MKTKRWFWPVVMLIVAPALAFAAGQGDTAAAKPSGPVTLTMFYPIDPKTASTVKSYNELLYFKEMEKRTLYTMLSRPVRRWEFIVGKFFGLAGTLGVNTFLMTVGFYAALFYLARGFTAADAQLLVALYFIMLQLLMVTALALLFSTFSSPVLSAVFAFALFIAGSFAEDLRAFAAMSEVASTRWMAVAAAYLVPNFSALNVISSVAHGQPVAGALIVGNTLYALFYSGAALFAAILVFEHRNLK